ncbi:hypothetical protein [Opitutus sp. ER46]|uniref:hypothetical protein n=1 Tax=Opitutus sp. ER46 TaxID=2161864 RepID=UPI000D3225CF|nr:hypothetical protein [Opitutus sp. ER46]PTX95754.1 hypothetical protein DB354_10105 [Opitutus sp. ER46]
MPPRTTPLLSNKDPLVNAGAIALPVLTSVGEWAHLTASTTQWRKIVCDLAKPLGLELVPAGTMAVVADPESITEALLGDAAFRAAVTNAVRRAHKACTTAAPADRSPAAARLPLTKPGNGRLL